jgi:PAS domain S-box-containing protein
LDFNQRQCHLREGLRETLGSTHGWDCLGRHNTKTSRNELEKRTIEFQNLVETMNEGLAIVDENMILTYVNPRLSQMLGYAQEEMISQHVDNIFDQENLKIVIAQFEKRKKGHEESYTVNLLRKDGTGLQSLVAPAVVFDENEEFIHSIAVISDISEQVRIHRLLDMRVSKRRQEISSLMDVSCILVSPISFHDQLKNILEKLGVVINFDGLSVLLRKENLLIAETFQMQLTQEKSEELVQPFIQPDLVDARYWKNEDLIFPDVRSQFKDASEYLSLTESVFSFVPPEMVSWIGIPIKSRRTLVGVLSAHAAQVDFFTQEIAEFMQAFGN